MSKELQVNQPENARRFMQLMFENDRRIYAYIYILVPNQTDADDIFQDTMTVMWDKFHAFGNEGDFGAWGIVIAYNLVKNYRRKKARSRLRFEEDIENLIDGESRETLSQLDDRIEALRKCLSKLNQPEQKMIQLQYVNNYSTRMIAEKIGCTIKAVYIKLARANDLLLRCVRRTLAEQGIK